MTDTTTSTKGAAQSDDAPFNNLRAAFAWVQNEIQQIERKKTPKKKFTQCKETLLEAESPTDDEFMIVLSETTEFAHLVRGYVERAGKECQLELTIALSDGMKISNELKVFLAEKLIEFDPADSGTYEWLFTEPNVPSDIKLKAGRKLVEMTEKMELRRDRRTLARTYNQYMKYMLKGGKLGKKMYKILSDLVLADERNYIIER